MKTIEMVYQDDDLVAVNKPAGLQVHRSGRTERGQAFLLQQVRDAVGRRVYPVHRLDRPTSGVMVLAAHPAAAAVLARTFSNHQVQKTYLAVVRGWIAPVYGRIDNPIAAKPRRMDPRPKVRSAVSDYRRLAVAELDAAVGRYPTARYSLVRVCPQTGRTHQIRRHLKHLHYPVIGDTIYGDGAHNRFFRSRLGCHRLLLAAVELVLPHPGHGRPIVLTGRLDAAFSGIMHHMCWQTAVPAPWHPSCHMPVPALNAGFTAVLTSRCEPGQ